jgi:hypothetical protein
MNQSTEFYQCECGAAIQRRHYDRHAETQRHRDYLKQRIKQKRREIGYAHYVLLFLRCTAIRESTYIVNEGCLQSQSSSMSNSSIYYMTLIK